MVLPKKGKHNNYEKKNAAGKFAYKLIQGQIARFRAGGEQPSLWPDSRGTNAKIAKKCPIRMHNHAVHTNTAEQKASVELLTGHNYSIKSFHVFIIGPFAHTTTATVSETKRNESCQF